MRTILLLALTSLCGCSGKGALDPHPDEVRDTGSPGDSSAPDTASDTGDSGVTTDTGADLARGAEVYQTSCGSGYCHGPDGVSGPAPDHTTAVPALDDEALVAVIQNGSDYMPPVGLDEEGLADVLAYLRATFP